MQIYYINRARDMDRRMFTEEQLGRLGLVAERVDAVTRDDLTDEQRDDIRRIDAASSKTRGYCITLSHLEAMRRLLASRASHALVMEDDVLLSGRLPAFLAAFDAAPPPVDLLRIETSGHLLRIKPAESTLLEFGVCRVYSFEGGRAGYIVTRGGAQAISTSREVLRFPHDVSMFDPYQPVPRRLRVRQLNPALCMQAQYREDSDGPRFVGTAKPGPALRRLGFKGSMRRVLQAVRRDTVVAAQKAWHQHVGGARKQRVAFVPD